MLIDKDAKEDQSAVAHMYFQNGERNDSIMNPIHGFLEVVQNR